MSKGKKFTKIEVTVFDHATPLTVEQAQDYLGWEEESEANQFGKDYLFRDMNGKKVRLNNNVTNRPFRRSLAMRYANEILRGKWTLNGETFVFDEYGMSQSGQHRGVGLVFAEQLRKKNVERNKELYGWRGQVTIEALVVTGISSKPETTDTLDLGQKRTLGDVIFRNHDFGELSDREQKALSRTLAGAARLAWIRLSGNVVSDAKHFPHSEALDFIEHHPRLEEACQFIWTEEGGTGAEGKRISTYLTLPYAAALLYLMAAIKTDREKFDENGRNPKPDFEAVKITRDSWNKACEFWTLFASGASLDKEDPILVLRNYLPKIEASSGIGRDTKVGTVVKAFNLWLDGKKAATAKAIKVAVTQNDAGKNVLAETPRLGGLDVEIEPIPDDEDDAGNEPDTAAPEGDENPTEGEEGAKAGKAKKGKGKGKKDTATPAEELKEGTRVEVKSTEGNWQGVVVTESVYGNGRKVVEIKADEDGKIYEEDRVNVAKA